MEAESSLRGSPDNRTDDVAVMTQTMNVEAQLRVALAVRWIGANIVTIQNSDAWSVGWILWTSVSSVAHTM